MEKRKVIKCVIDEEGKLGVYAIGLVEAPAIQENWVALSDIKLTSLNEERRMLYGPALIPDKHILRLNPETKEEYYIYFDRETIYRASHLFLKKHLQNAHTLEHELAVTGCTVVESWYKESESDKATHLGINVPDGTWMIGTHVEDDGVWQEVKAGRVKGFSIEGMFDEEQVKMTSVEPLANMLKEIEDLVYSYKG
jgi:hypothetical protein